MSKCPYIYLSIFESCVELTALHSFPTRRSSDLTRARVAAAPGRPRQVLLEEREVAPRPRALGRRPDRKSTRLNSSHEWISYAVFCFKTKNNNIEIFLNLNIR